MFDKKILKQIEELTTYKIFDIVQIEAGAMMYNKQNEYLITPNEQEGDTSYIFEIVENKIINHFEL